jgi:hypothetical protein
VCDLALEDIFKLDYFKDIYTTTKAYVTFINNHQATLAAWRQVAAPGQVLDLTGQSPAAAASNSSSGGNLSLIKPGDTRFASAFLMLEHTDKLKAKLQQYIVSDGWNAAIDGMKRADKVICDLQSRLVLSV